MKFVNVKDAQARLPELLALLDSNPSEEVIIMRNHEPLCKISGFGSTLTDEDEKNLRERGWGAAKGKHELPPDFDEAFVAMDAEIWREVADSYEVMK